MTFQLALFDMAGTTVFDDDAVHHCLQAAMVEVAGCPVSRAACNAVMGIPKPVAIAALLRNAPGDAGSKPDPAAVDRILRNFERRIMDHYQTSPEVREVPGAADVFRELRSRGIRVALDTGFSRAVADVILHRLGWDAGGLLDATVTSDEVSAGRPAPDLVYRAMERTGTTDAIRVIKVGDTPSDLQEGTSAGCGLVVGVTAGSHTRAELEPHPHSALIETVRDLPPLLDGLCETGNAMRLIHSGTLANARAI